MNNYQKAGALVIRIIGGYMFLVCFIGLLLDMVDLAIPRQRQGSFPGGVTRVFEIPITLLVNEAVIAGVGLLLWLFAVPLGRLLGKRLD